MTEKTSRALFLLSVLLFMMAHCLHAGDSVRPGLENVNIRRFAQTTSERLLLEAIKQPFFDGMDVQDALQAWMDGHLLHTQGDIQGAESKWKSGLSMLSDLKPLPLSPWGPLPDATFTVIESFQLIHAPDVSLSVVQWSVDGLTQYGILMAPKQRPENAHYPLILYCHGAAFGIPLPFCDWLADIVRQGYVVIGPAMRGETLFQSSLTVHGKLLVCEGEIENLDGEVNDCLSMLSAAWKLPYVRPDEFAMIGHSFGAGVGLLTAACASKQAKAVVSYDAWLTSPQRFYWDRMAQRANNWLSWADYCNQPVADQLAGLMKRSIVHHARQLTCPMQFFIGGNYDGSVFHLSHQDLMDKLKQFHADFHYDIMPLAGHNFVLETTSPAAKNALEIQSAFLKRVYPPYSSTEK